MLSVQLFYSLIICIDFYNKVVLITGAASGLGEKTALEFAKVKANLSIIDINEENVKKTAENCKQLSEIKALALKADLTKDEEMKRVIDDTLIEYGKIDVVINCAGVYGIASILDEHVMDCYDKIIAVNLRSVAAVIHYAAPALIESKGCIVNVTSTAAVLNVAGSTPYCISKAAATHLSKCIALELATKGVRVNSVLPGGMRTNLLLNAGISKQDDDANWDLTEASAPLKQLEDTSDVAELIVFLSSDKAKGITGANFVIDAGLLLSGIKT